MTQGWATEERARAHRQALMAEAEMHRRSVRARSDVHATSAATKTSSQRSVTGLPAGGRAVRRRGRVGQRVGTWLINAGTRIGGASISPS
jgi:hypothetical protein